MKLLGDIARLVDGTVEGDSDRPIDAVRPLESAGPRDLCYVADYRLAGMPSPEELQAAALICDPTFAGDAYRERTSLLRVANPKLAWAQTIDLLHELPEPPFQRISDRATVHESAELGDGVSIAPGAFVSPGCRIGSGTVIHPGAYLGAEAEVGEHCVIHPNVTIYPRSRVGSHVILHASCVIGCDGFGYAPSPRGAHKIRHIGRAIIEDHCEIGAGTVVDRGALDDTVIRTGSKLDNLIQIGHNCVVGPHALMAAQSGAAGSTTIGQGVQVGGQAGMGGHSTIGDGARIGAQAGVHSNLAAGTEVFGTPAMEVGRARRVFAVSSRLPELRDQIRDLVQRVKELEGGQ